MLAHVGNKAARQEQVLRRERGMLVCQAVGRSILLLPLLVVVVVLGMTLLGFLYMFLQFHT
eukprot:2586909-Amphidinium_carterae.1